MTSSFGALDLPVPLGIPASPFVDPLIIGLLDLLAFCIKDAIEDRLAQTRTAIADACPVANRFDYDPRQSFVRNPMPALYIWWSGRSKNVEATTVRNRRDRDLSLLYVAGSVKYPDGAPVFAGVMGAVDAAIAQASDRGYHPNYAFGNDVLGTPLVLSLAPKGTVGWEYTGGQVGILEPVPRRGRKADPNALEDCFPALQGTIRVSERRTDSTADDEILGDGTLTITSDGVAYFTRALAAS